MSGRHWPDGAASFCREMLRSDPTFARRSTRSSAAGATAASDSPDIIWWPSAKEGDRGREGDRGSPDPSCGTLRSNVCYDCAPRGGGGGGRQGRGRRARLAHERIFPLLLCIFLLSFLCSFSSYAFDGSRRKEKGEPQGTVKLRGRVSDWDRTWENLKDRCCHGYLAG